MSELCPEFVPNPMNLNSLCKNCFKHKHDHPPSDPYYQQKLYRKEIEEILYESEDQDEFSRASVPTVRLMQNLPPPEVYFKIFNVYSFVRQNLTNPRLKDLAPEDKMSAIYITIDFLLTIVLPLRRPLSFEKVSKLRRKNEKMMEAEKLEGTQDVISRLGYTKWTEEHFEFPSEVVSAPDQTMIREIAADLKIALEEVKCFHHMQHKFPERFQENFEWARKTTPFAPESLTDLVKFDKKVDALIGGKPAPLRNPSTAPNPPIIPPPTTPVTMDPPQYNFERYPPPRDTLPYSSYVRSMPPIPKADPYEPPIPPKMDDYQQPGGMIPEPIPENMVKCPVPSCQALNPKNLFACSKCRYSLHTSPDPNPPVSLVPGILQVEKWICVQCTYENTTAQGRTRICEVCTTTNPNPVQNISPSASFNPFPPTQNLGDFPKPLPQAQPLLQAQQHFRAKPYEERQPTTEPSIEEEVFERSSNPQGNEPIYLPNKKPNFSGPIQKVPGPDPNILSNPVHNPNFPEQRPIYPQNPNPAFPVYRPEMGMHIVMDPFMDPNRNLRGPNFRPREPFLPFAQMDPPQGEPFMREPFPKPQPQPYKHIKHIISQTYQEYKDEALQIALDKYGPGDAIKWLSTQYKENVKQLTENVRRAEYCETITPAEVEESYIQCRGDMAKVTPRIQLSRSSKLEELMRSHDIGRDVAIAELEKSCWNVLVALDSINLIQNQRSLGEFNPMLWAGSNTVPEVPVDDIDAELWEQVKVLADNNIEMDSKILRKFLCELKIPTLTQLNLLLQLVILEETQEREPKDLVQAVIEVSDYDAAIKFLNQECEICMESYIANEMIQMFFCTDSVCKGCLSGHFTHVVRNSAIKKWTCPVCSEPDIQQMDDPYEYFGLLSTVVKELCDPVVDGLYHQKLNEFAICKRPEFRWCPHCHCGFMGGDGMEKKLVCPQPECRKMMCYQCKRKWEPEHDGRTCEEYQEWREENDRDILDKGLAAKLVEEGVECPCCKFKYELVRGGCMHFRCNQCPAEFCSGCFQLFKKENCLKFDSCATKGLHAHHPRNCMYFTRDMEVDRMKELLEKGGFQRDEAVQAPQPEVAEPEAGGAHPNPPKKKKPKIYKVKVPEQHRIAVVDELKTKAGEAFQEPPQGELKIPCQVFEFKENPDGGYEKENCIKHSLEKDGYAGLCEKHYKEYLSGLITQHGLDPIDVLVVTEDSIFELWAVLKRNEIPFDDKLKGDALKQLIKEKLPLQPMNVIGTLQPN